MKTYKYDIFRSNMREIMLNGHYRFVCGCSRNSYRQLVQDVEITDLREIELVAWSPYVLEQFFARQEVPSPGRLALDLLKSSRNPGFAARPLIAQMLLDTRVRRSSKNTEVAAIANCASRFLLYGYQSGRRRLLRPHQKKHVLSFVAAAMRGLVPGYSGPAIPDTLSRGTLEHLIEDHLRSFAPLISDDAAHWVDDLIEELTQQSLLELLPGSMGEPQYAFAHRVFTDYFCSSYLHTVLWLGYPRTRDGSDSDLSEAAWAVQIVRPVAANLHLVLGDLEPTDLNQFVTESLALLYGHYRAVRRYVAAQQVAFYWARSGLDSDALRQELATIRRELGRPAVSEDVDTGLRLVRRAIAVGLQLSNADSDAYTEYINELATSPVEQALNLTYQLTYYGDLPPSRSIGDLSKRDTANTRAVNLFHELASRLHIETSQPIASLNLLTVLHALRLAPAAAEISDNEIELLLNATRQHQTHPALATYANAVIIELGRRADASALAGTVSSVVS